MSADLLIDLAVAGERCFMCDDRAEAVLTETHLTACAQHYERVRDLLGLIRVLKDVKP